MPMMVMSESRYQGSRWKKGPKLIRTDMGPERQSGRKAQTANIVAAKVGSASLSIQLDCD